MQSTQSVPRAIGFLDLPCELRSLIYHELFDDTILTVGLPISAHLIASILEVCQCIRQEASAVFWSTVAFELDIEDIRLLAESLRNRIPLQLRWS
jgi:hypothetical protein